MVSCEESMTAIVQQQIIREKLEYFLGTDKHFQVVAMTTDNASVMLATARLLGFNHVGCFAHALQLCLKSHLSGKKKSVFNLLVQKVLFLC